MSRSPAGRAPRGQARRTGRRRRARARSRSAARSSRAAGSSSPTRSRACGWTSSGRRALDVGASTGGFTDCLLQRGAREVIAVDVGYGMLDYRLRSDPRVSVLERTNARALTPDDAARRRRSGAGPSLPDLATRRRVVHLAREGARRRCSAASAAATTCSRWSSPSSSSAAAASAKAASCATADDRREALIGVGAAGARAGRGGARLPLLGAAGTEGQPRDVHLAGGPASGRGDRADPAALERMAREVEP